MRGKKKRSDNNSKIIPFPGLAERLIQRGLEALREKNFNLAADLFSQARELEPEDAELNIGLVVSLVELGVYGQAKEICKELLFKGIGDYFQVVNIYLMILLQLNEHQEMIDTIHALLEEKQVPPDKEEQFQKMLEFCQRVMYESDDRINNFPDEDEHEFVNEVPSLRGKSEQEQLIIISRLSQVNIRPHINEVKDFLIDPSAHPFLKTMLVNILKEQEIGEKIEIEKFSSRKNITPSKLRDIQSTDFLIKTLAEMEKRLSHENPSLLEIAKSLIERHNFILYPLEPQEKTYIEWAAAYHIVAKEYQGLTSTICEIIDIYGIEEKKVMRLVSAIRDYEEISNPII